MLQQASGGVAEAKEALRPAQHEAVAPDYISIHILYTDINT